MILYEIRKKKDINNALFEIIEQTVSEKLAYEIYNDSVIEHPDKYFELRRVEHIIIKTYDGSFKE